MRLSGTIKKKYSKKNFHSKTFLSQQKFPSFLQFSNISRTNPQNKKFIRHIKKKVPEIPVQETNVVFFQLS